MLHQLANGIVDLIVPPLCTVCHQLHNLDDNFCDRCRTDFLTDPFHSCSRCGATIGPYSEHSSGCSKCRGTKFAFDDVVRIGPYEGLRRDVVLRCKSDEVFCESVANVFAGGIVARLKKQRVDRVIPVPLHWWRRCRRGYNQAEVLARALGQAIGTPCDTRSLRRVRATPFQTSMEKTSRWENVEGAFSARRRDMRGMQVVLVDDVVTTGATADAAARVLRDLGVAKILVAALAHG